MTVLAAKGISMREAKSQAEAEMGRPIKSCGFEHREVGGHIVNILYYSCEYEEIGTVFRMKLWVDSAKTMGAILS